MLAEIEGLVATHYQFCKLATRRHLPVTRYLGTLLLLVELLIRYFDYQDGSEIGSRTGLQTACVRLISPAFSPDEINSVHTSDGIEPV